MWQVRAMLVPGGELFLAVWGKDLAQLQSSGAQAGSPRAPGPCWAQKASLSLSGAPALRLPFKVPCCLKKHSKYFLKGPLCGSNRK